MPKKKVIVAMSGGVDSSVAAALLKKRGYEITGVFMHFWSEEGDDMVSVENKCCSVEAQEGARRVAQKLNIPFYTLNFREDFKKYIVDYFLDTYQKGLTPNPCIVCNQRIKFDFLLKKALRLRADFLATGHYARKVKRSNRFALLKGKDRKKDQSYFLYTLGQKQLKHLLFPVGNYTKQEVRKLAEKFKLPTAQRDESQGICFIPGKDHNDFLKKYLKSLKPGKIVDTKGKILARHEGLPLYTLGQRKNIKIGGVGPYYVCELRSKTNELVVTNNPRDERLYEKSLMADKVSWILGKRPGLPFACEAKIRHMKQPFRVVVKSALKKGKDEKVSVVFKKPQRAVMPGQSVVFYRGEEVVGGGVICKE